MATTTRTAPTDRAAATLTADLPCVALHGVTRVAYETGTLEAGALIRRVVADATEDGPVWLFQASTDAGRTWYDHRSYEPPRVH